MPTLLPVPNETKAGDNICTAVWIFITLSGDVDGDRDIDIFDIVRMAGVYGKSKPDPKYDPDCDIEDDGDTDIYDITIAAGNYNKNGYSYQKIYSEFLGKMPHMDV